MPEKAHFPRGGLQMINMVINMIRPVMLCGQNTTLYKCCKLNDLKVRSSGIICSYVANVKKGGK